MSPITIRIVFFVLLLRVPTLLFSQLTDEYIKGSVILKNNERREGYIRSDDFKKMNYELGFKETLSQGKPIIYDTSSVKGFTMDDGESYDLLRYKPNQGNDSIAVFAMLIIKGKASLYKVFYNEATIYIVVANQRNFPVQDDEMPINTGEVVQNNYKDYLKLALLEYSDLYTMIDKMEFGESDIMNIIKEYNKHFMSESIITHVKESPKDFIFCNVDKGWTRSLNSVFNTYEAMYRVYYPKILKNTSFNIGLRYVEGRISNVEQVGDMTNGIFDTVTVIHKRRYLSIPIRVHQNLLDGWFRPYAYVGATFYGLYSEVNNVYQEDNGAGFDNYYGTFLCWGGGVEADIYKGLMFRAEYRSEERLYILGIGYLLPIDSH